MMIDEKGIIREPRQRRSSSELPRITQCQKRNRRQTLSDDLSVVPNETPSVHTPGPPKMSPHKSHPTLGKTNTSELTPNSQSARPKARRHCGRCQNCFTYGKNVRHCKGFPTQNLKPTSTRPPTPNTPSKTSSSSLSSSSLQNNLKQKQNTSEWPSRTKYTSNQSPSRCKINPRPQYNPKKQTIPKYQNQITSRSNTQISEPSIQKKQTDTSIRMK